MAWIRCCVEEKEAMESCGRDEEEVGDEDGSSSGFGGMSASEAAMALEEREMPPCPPGLRQYETMVVLRPDMSEEERLALIQRLAPTYAVLPNGFDHLCSSLLLHAVRRRRDLASPLGTAKAGAGSATLSMAYAAAKFADACLRGLRGDAGIVECSYIASQVTELPFFASKVRLGRSGVEEVLPLGPLNEFERSAEVAAAAAAAAAGGTGRSPHGCCTSEVGCDLMVTLLFCSA